MALELALLRRDFAAATAQVRSQYPDLAARADAGDPGASAALLRQRTLAHVALTENRHWLETSPAELTRPDFWLRPAAPPDTAAPFIQADAAYARQQEQQTLDGITQATQGIQEG